MASQQILPENSRFSGGKKEEYSRFSGGDEEDEVFANIIGQFQSESRQELDGLIKEEENDLHSLLDGNIINQRHFTPEEISELTDEVFCSSEFDSTFTIISSSEIEEVGETDSSDSLDEYIEALDTVCEQCVEHEKVHQVSQIRPGAHIRFHRKKVRFIPYNHHAIVTGVHHDVNSSTVGKFNVVHFSPTDDGKRKVFSETITIDVQKESVDLIQYPNNPFTADQIITRAKEMAEKYANNPTSYNLIRDNCEHRANTIATGNRFSQQVSRGLNYAKSTISWFLKFLLKIGIRIFTFMKGVIRGFAHIVVIGSLLALVDQIASLKKQLKKGLICLSCYQRQRNVLMVSLVFCLISIGISVVHHVGWLYVGVSTILAAFLPFLSSFFIDKVMARINPAANIPQPLVRHGNMVRVGDIITFRYIGLLHEGVVTSASPFIQEGNHSVKLSVIHYNYPGLFGTRTVVKEDMFFNLKNENVHIYDFRGVETFPPAEVVQRARDKVGEQKFNSFWNRSSHMCRLCKTGRSELTDLPYKKASSLTDFSPGDVIDFTYCSVPHQGIVEKVEYPESIECSVVHYNYAGIWGTRSVVEETFVFNLSDQDLYVHHYKEDAVYEADEVVQRARSRIGEKKFNTFSNRSSHLTKWCKMK